MSYKVGLGQDSHAFVAEGEEKPCVLGGVHIPNCPGLKGNSDADVVLHALCNAISGISGIPVLGPVTDRLLREEGVSDSAVYAARALETLTEHRLTHVSVSLECLRPKILPHIDAMRKRIAAITGLEIKDVAVTATTGEGLTAFGRGEGVQALVIATAASVSVSGENATIES